MAVPLVAAIDLGDLREFLVPLLVAAGWILSRLAALIRGLAGPPAKPPVVPPDLQRELARRAARPVPPVPVPPRPVAGQPAGAGDPREELARQIEDFLAGRSGAPGQPPGPPRPAARGPAESSPRRSPTPPTPKPLAKEPARRNRPPSESSPASRPAAVPRSAVGGAIGAGEVGSLAARTTAVARHVEGVFHDEGRAPLPGAAASVGAAAVRPGTTVVEQAPTTVAAELVAALRDPGTLRRMILLREILDRPVTRW